MRGVLQVLRVELCPRYNWCGIHERFDAVGVPSAGFSDDRWALDTRALTERAMEINRKGSIPSAVRGDDALLPLLCSVFTDRSSRLRIVDFGGGTGISYVMLSSAMILPCAIDYVVVETARVAQEGAALFHDDPAIHFVTDIPAVSDPVDVVLISTALQYVEDWAALLRRLAQLKPRFFLLSRLSAGDVPGYVATQVNLEGFEIPYRFFNLTELVNVMEHLGYALRFKCASVSDLNQDNYPPTHRLGHACDLLFIPSNTR